MIDIKKFTPKRLIVIGGIIDLTIWIFDSISDYLRKPDTGFLNNFISMNYDDVQLRSIVIFFTILLVVALSKSIRDRIEYEKSLRNKLKEEGQLVYVITNNLKRAAEANVRYLQRLKDRFGETLDVRVQESSEKILEIIEELDFYETIKKMPTKVELADIGKLVQEVKEEVSSQLEERKIDWGWENPRKIKKIRADHVLIKRAINNLVINSLKFGEDKLSKIVVSIKKTKRYFEISVSDNGPGIKNAKLIDPFDPFKRENKSMDVDGMGIGLAIVKEVAKKHKGNMWFKPRESGGVIFNISISRQI